MDPIFRGWQDLETPELIAQIEQACQAVPIPTKEELLKTWNSFSALDDFHLTAYDLPHFDSLVMREGFGQAMFLVVESHIFENRACYGYRYYPKRAPTPRSSRPISKEDARIILESSKIHGHVSTDLKLLRELGYQDGDLFHVYRMALCVFGKPGVKKRTTKAASAEDE